MFMDYVTVIVGFMLRIGLPLIFLIGIGTLVERFYNQKVRNVQDVQDEG